MVIPDWSLSFLHQFEGREGWMCSAAVPLNQGTGTDCTHNTAMKTSNAMDWTAQTSLLAQKGMWGF